MEDERLREVEEYIDKVMREAEVGIYLENRWIEWEKWERRKYNRRKIQTSINTKI
jgi:hypothetical protein